jgi:hypothetical protein
VKAAPVVLGNKIEVATLVEAEKWDVDDATERVTDVAATAAAIPETRAGTKRRRPKRMQRLSSLVFEVVSEKK